MRLMPAHSRAGLSAPALQQAGADALSELVWKIGASRKKGFCSFIDATSFCSTTVCLRFCKLSFKKRS